MSIVHDFERAFNGQDVNALLDCFTEDASYHDSFSGAHSGQARLRKRFERMFHEGRDYAWKMDVVVDAPLRAAAEWTFSYVVTDVIPRSAGRRVGSAG
jgi:ketosteroid isomerase-like protein